MAYFNKRKPTVKIPISGKIGMTINAETLQTWRLFSKKTITRLGVDGYIPLPGNQGVNVRIQLTDVLSPEDIRLRRISLGITKDEGISDKECEGIVEVEKALENYFEEKKWYLFGKFVSTKEEEVCIVVIPKLKLAIYTQASEEKKVRVFGPGKWN